MKQVKYTQDQLDIEILKNNQTGILQSLARLENKIDKLDSKIDKNFYWSIGLTLGLYLLVITTLTGALGHAYHWF